MNVDARSVVAAQARIGDVIAGRYEFRRVLGAGGMGAVYEAFHKFTGRRVAVKVLRPEVAHSADAAARFLREARAPASVGHPNIVEVLDAGVGDDGGLYIVLELLEGETLQDVLRTGRCTPRPLVGVALALLDALEAAHARGLVHRDIKPANIFLPSGGGAGAAPRVKLLDFGIAREIEGSDEITEAGAIVGSRDYMSPEQAFGTSIDARTDLWGVGATLFRCLTGRAPLPRRPDEGYLAAFVAHAPPSLATLRDDLPAALVEAVDRALEKTPDARWPDARAMAARLRDADEALARTGASRGFAPAVADEASSADASLSPPVRPPPRSTPATDSAREAPPPAAPRVRAVRRVSLGITAGLLASGAVAWLATHRAAPVPAAVPQLARAEAAAAPHAPPAAPTAPALTAPAPTAPAPTPPPAVVPAQVPRRAGHAARPTPPASTRTAHRRATDIFRLGECELP